MARSTTTTTNWQNTNSQSNSNTQSQSHSQSQSESRNFLDADLLNQIMSGLMGPMTNEEISAFAENLLRPQLNAGLEAAQQNYETTQMAKQQEIELLADALTRSVAEQENAYGKSVANVETGALSRGMGRSSYTMQNIANQGQAFAKAVENLTRDTQKQQSFLQNQITQAAQHNAQTQGRLNTDYAAQLAAKIQELRQQQASSYNQNYLTAISSAMGRRTTGSEQTHGTSQTQQNSTSQTNGGSTSVTTTGGGGRRTSPDPIGNNG